MAGERPFSQFGWQHPVSPVVLSVPHAGRHYPANFGTIARLPPSRLRGLEDRFADALIEGAVAAGTPAIVANTARAWIDLNRSEREFDPALIAGGQSLGPIASAKVRGGLGVVPKSLSREGELWRGPLSVPHFIERLERHHRPYHAALAAMIEAALSKFGVAILLDIHSMPTLTPLPDGSAAPAMVVGDLFGRAAAGRFAQTAMSVLALEGTLVALNSPYAGGYILERHTRPNRNVHGLQIEIDRSLYLDEALDEPGPGLAALRSLIAQLVEAMAAEALSDPFLLAAE